MILVRMLFLLLLPLAVSAQDATLVQRRANVIASALMKSDFKTIVANTYPKAVAMGGGSEKMLQLMTTAITQMKGQGFSFEKVTIGTPGKFYKAGTQIHCLVPENIIINTSRGRMSAKSNLLAISDDHGKNWTFLDLNQGTVNTIKTLFPNFNNNLVIPTPQPPTML